MKNQRQHLFCLVFVVCLDCFLKKAGAQQMNRGPHAQCFFHLFLGASFFFSPWKNGHQELLKHLERDFAGQLLATAQGVTTSEKAGVVWGSGGVGWEV